MTDDEKRTFCRIVGTLVLSDLKLKDSELDYMASLYERLDLDEAAQREIQSSINLREDVAKLARSLSESAGRELIDALKEAAAVDGEIASTEAEIIRLVEEAVG